MKKMSKEEEKNGDRREHQDIHYNRRQNLHVRRLLTTPLIHKKRDPISQSDHEEDEQDDAPKKKDDQGEFKHGGPFSLKIHIFDSTIL